MLKYQEEQELAESRAKFKMMEDDVHVCNKWLPRKINFSADLEPTIPKTSSCSGSFALRTVDFNSAILVFNSSTCDGYVPSKIYVISWTDKHATINAA